MSKGGGYVYSTSSTNLSYPEYAKTAPGQPPRIIRAVIVKGGANVANKHVITPYGVATEVTEEEATFLVTNENFQRHVVAGFVRYEARKHDPEVVAADMEARDGSSPLVPADFEADGKKAPTTERKAA